MKKIKKRVLVVEDNPILLSFWERLLNDLGSIEAYFSTDATHAKVLLNKFEFDLLISDVILPTINGYELAKFARNMRPDIEVILTTGYETNLSRFDLKGYSFHIIHKPYSNIAKLSTIIMHLLRKEDPFADADEDSFSENEDYPEITEWTL